MDNNIKILLSIKLQGGSLSRQGDKVIVTNKAIQHININKSAYNTFISDAFPAKKFSKRDWSRLKENKRIEAHLKLITDSLNGISFSYELLED